MRLKFHLLGPPRVTWDDLAVDIPRRQVRVLLYYLASYPNAVPQERLHYLFWNNKSDAECRRNISHLLTHARSSLPEKDVLVVKESLIMLNPEKVWCDVVEFKRLIRSARKDDRLAVFKKAVEYYQGPFLDGLQFSEEPELEKSIELERFNLERNYLNLLYKMLLIEKQNGSYESAIEHGYQYLAIDNLSEEVHRQLIILYGLTGNRERAVKQYQTCEGLLQRELQTQPSMKTQLAYHNVLADSKTVEKNLLFRDSVEVRMVADEPGFVNSESLKQFTGLLDGVKSGGVAVLHGEMGIGKSSLFTKVLSGIGGNRLILRTRCDPGVRLLSFWPIKYLLLKECQAYPSIKTLLPDSLIRESAGEEEESDGTTGDDTDAYSKEYLFTVFTDCILSLADERSGLILCIEDLEWADADTLELFLHLCRYAKGKKLLLLGSYCCPENENLKGFLHNLQLMDAYAGVIKVQGISLEETGSIVRYWIGDDRVDQLMIERLHKLTGGNPFFISEILRGIAESEISADIFKEIDNLQLPLTINKAVSYRLSRLGQIERRVLEVAAVIGYSFHFEQLIEPSGLTAMQVLDALDEIVNRHFLFVRSAKYMFAHDLLRNSILEEMGPIRRHYLEMSIAGTR